MCNAANLVVSSTVKYMYIFTLPYKQLLYRGQKSILSVAGSTTPVRQVRQKPDHYYCDCMGTWGSLVSLRGMVTPIPISLVILGWGSHITATPVLASSPGPLRGGERRAWYTLFAHALFSQQTLGICILIRLFLRKRDLWPPLLSYELAKFRAKTRVVANLAVNVGRKRTKKL